MTRASSSRASSAPALGSLSRGDAGRRAPGAADARGAPVADAEVDEGVARELETGSFAVVDPETGEWAEVDPETGEFEAVEEPQ